MTDPDPMQAASVEDLAACLKQLHVLADSPALRDLEQRTSREGGTLPGTPVKRVPLRRSTLSDVLQGRKFPRKAFYLTFVEACGVDLADDGRWEQAWNRLALQYSDHDSRSAELHQQVEELRAQLAAAEQRASDAEEAVTAAREELAQQVASNKHQRDALDEAQRDLREATAARKLRERELRQAAAPAETRARETEQTADAARAHAAKLVADARKILDEGHVAATEAERQRDQAEERAQRAEQAAAQAKQAARDGERGRMNVLRVPWQPTRIDLWPEDRDPPAGMGALRIVGGLEHSGTPYLSRLNSAARQDALNALNNSPLRQSLAWFLTTWETKEVRPTHLRFLAGEVPHGTHRAQAAAYLRLDDRRLSMLAGFRWTEKTGWGGGLSLEDFYHALLGAMITIASTCKHVAGPSGPLDWEGWLQPGVDRSVADVVNFGSLSLEDASPDSTSDPQTGHFPVGRTTGANIEELDALARDWLTYWLFEMGARNFDERIARWDRPKFLRMPDLA